MIDLALLYQLKFLGVSLATIPVVFGIATDRWPGRRSHRRAPRQRRHPTRRPPPDTSTIEVLRRPIEFTGAREASRCPHAGQVGSGSEPVPGHHPDRDHPGGFLASATAAVSLAEPLVPLLDFFDGAAEAVAIALVTVVLTFLTLVFGELAPKRLAMQNALRWALLVARPLDVLSAVSRPAVWALSASTSLVVRLFGGRPDAESEQMSPEELRELVSAQRGLNVEQRMIITGALEIHERRLREVLVPRRAVVTLAAETDVAAARAELAASGHSRAPVARGGHLDDVVGVVHLRDLLDDRGSVGEVVRPAVVFPDTVRVSDALRRFKAEREQMALVVDEHGAVAGMVTLEDLLEEIVGEIYDETDRDVMAVRAAEDGSLVLPGTFPVHDLVDLGVELPDAPDRDYATIAGLVLAVLGHIPEAPGERVVVSGWTIEVLAVEHHAITRVRLRRGSGEGQVGRDLQGDGDQGVDAGGDRGQ